MDPKTGLPQSNPQLLPKGSYSGDQIALKSPALEAETESTIQISLNNVDWHDVRSPLRPYSFKFYASPHINSVSPKFGIVKNPEESYLTI